MNLEQKIKLDKILYDIHIIGPYDKSKLQEQAVNHYKMLWKDTPFMLESIDNASKKQMEQWMVNYIRHKLTGYDEALVKINAMVPNGYEILKFSILDKISCMYPFLKDECERQKAKLSWRIW